MKLNKGKKYVMPEKLNILECPTIKEKLICPKCQHKIDSATVTLSCTNTSCGAVYPVIDNVPILINESENVFSIEEIQKNNVTHKNNGYVKRSLKKILGLMPTLSNNLSSKKKIQITYGIVKGT